MLFVSPYPICPPVHGGGVFMYQTLRELAKLAEVHVVELLDWPEQDAGEPGTARLLRLGRVAGAPERAHAGTRLARAARRPRVRQRRSGLADPPPDLHAADRRAAARVHADGAVRGRVPADRERAVRARCLLPVDRPRPGATCAGLLDEMQGAHRISAGAALRAAHAAGAGPGAGLHAGESRLPAVVSARSWRAQHAGRACAPASTPSRYEFRTARPRAADDAVPRQLPARRRTGWRWIGSCACDAADSGATSRRRGWWSSGRDPPPAHAYADLAGASAIAGIRGGCARAAVRATRSSCVRF